MTTTTAALVGALQGVLLILTIVAIALAVATGFIWTAVGALGAWVDREVGTILSTAAGVFLAFWLERWRTRRASRERFGRALRACLYDLAQLQAACASILANIQPGKTLIMPLDAPRSELSLRVRTCTSTGRMPS
jgi:hypothetical protein